MTYDPRVNLNNQISEEAAEWFIEFRTGDIDASARRAFDAWVRSSPEHLRAYVEVAAIWNEGSALDAERTLDIDILTARVHAEDNVVSLELRSPEAPGRLTPGNACADVGSTMDAAQPQAHLQSRRFAVAASVAFLTFATATLLWFGLYRVPTYATDVGEQRSIRLPDGSTVELNSRSRLRVRFTEAERTVELLEGQALFNVAKNPARPFIVRSDETRVRAVGTQFDVYKKRGGTIVTVVEGRVAVVTDPSHSGAGASAAVGPSRSALSAPFAVSNTEEGSAKEEGATKRVDSKRSEGKLGERSGAGAAVFLNAGEQLTVTAQAAPQPTRVNVAAATAWTQRQLVLESAPLTEVAEEFNRYSTRKLVVEDSATNALRLSGVFVTDPDFLIRYLRERSDTIVHETQTEIRIIHHD